MRQGAPTNPGQLDPKALSPEAWATLRQAAQRSGLPFEEWLKARLLADAPASPTAPAMGDLQRRVAELAGEIDRLAEPPPVPHRGSRATPAGETLVAALGSLNARIDSLLRDPEKGTPAAAAHLDETVRRLTERLEALGGEPRTPPAPAPSPPPSLAPSLAPSPAPSHAQAPVDPRSPESRSFEARMGAVARSVEQLSRRLEQPEAPRADVPTDAGARLLARDPALDAAIKEIAARQRRLESDLDPSTEAVASPTVTGAVAAPMGAAIERSPRNGSDLSWLERQLNTIADQMSQLTQGSGTEAVAALRGDLAEMRRALDALAPLSAVEELERAVAEIAERLDAAGSRSGDASAEIALTLGQLARTIDTLRPPQSPHAVAGEIEALSRKLDIVSAKTVDGATIARLQAQTTEIRDLLGRALSNDAVRQLTEQVSLLANRVNALSATDERLVGDVVEALGQRIDQLAARIEAHALRHDSGPPEAAGLAGLDDIVRRLDDVHAAVADAASIAPKGTQELFNQLMARIDQLARPDAAPGPSVETLGKELGKELGAQITSQLTAQIAAISERIDATDGRIGQFAGIERALNDLFVQMEEARASLLASAEHSARSSSESVSEGMAMLQRELADLGIRQENAERRTYDTFGSVNDTLGRVVDRIASLESGGLAPVASAALATGATRQSVLDDQMLAELLAEEPGYEAASQAADMRASTAQQPDAEHDAFPDDFPLEPGSGQPRHRARRIDPELSAMPSPAEAPVDVPAAAEPAGRVEPVMEHDETAAPKRADFIAAARRAAHVAGSKPKPEVASDKEGGFRLSRLLSRTRLPLLVGVCGSAVALAAWHYAGSVQGFNMGALSPATSGIDVATAGKPATSATTALGAGAQGAVPANIPSSGVLAAPSTFGAAPASGSTRAPAADSADVTGSVAPAATVEPAATPAPSPASSAAPTGELPASLGGPALRAAARAGDAAAAYEVGARFADGRGVGPNAARAADWFAYAVARGSIPAAYRLGVLLEKGAEGLNRDVARARKLYDSAANAGNVRAMHNYGVLLAEGIDGQPNYTEAVVWFRRAGERGVRDSQYNLGVLYTRGLGVKADLIEAWKWFSLAAAQGDAEAGKKREEVASRLDPQALVTARFAVQTWTPVQADDRANVALVNPDWDRAEAPTKRGAKTARL